MVQLKTEVPIMKDTKAIIDDFLKSSMNEEPSEIGEDEEEEDDALNTSCHGNHFKRMFDEVEGRCDAQTIKKRKLQTQIQIINNSFSAFSVTDLTCGTDPSERKKLVACRLIKDIKLNT